MSKMDKRLLVGVKIPPSQNFLLLNLAIATYTLFVELFLSLGFQLAGAFRSELFVFDKLLSREPQTARMKSVSIPMVSHGKMKGQAMQIIELTNPDTQPNCSVRDGLKRGGVMGVKRQWEGSEASVAKKAGRVFLRK